jgi:hypothetical protein
MTTPAQNNAAPEVAAPSTAVVVNDSPSVYTPAKFLALFPSRQNATALGIPTGQTDDKGKVQYQYLTVPRQNGFTEADVVEHLAGRVSIVAIAIQQDNTCQWASLDIDDYLIDPERVWRRCQQHNLPLHLFKSKSGGLHLMVFFKEPKPAAAVRRLLASWAEQIGVGKVEIFPKQDVVEGDRCGNGMNLPFFGDSDGLANFEPTYCNIPDQEWPEEMPKGWGPTGKAAAKNSASNPVHPNFDFEKFLAHYDITLRCDKEGKPFKRGDWYITDPCPVAGVNHGATHETGFFYDGKSLGWNCFDTSCDGHSMKIGQVIQHLNKPDGTRLKMPYAGPIWSELNSSAPLTFASAKVVGGDDDYVLGPLPEQLSDPVAEGHFPLGEVSLIGGTSGAGKSTILYSVAEQQKRGETRFDRPTYRRRYMIILRDRGERDVRLTFRRLGLDQSAVDYHSLEGEDRNKPVGEVIGRILDGRPAEERPEIVVVEGLDLGVDGTAVKMEDVVPVMDALQTTARHFNVAIVGTVGSPKMKVGEDFANERERLFGSGAWGRMAASVWTLTAAGKDAERVKLVMLGRHSKRQEVILEWQRGRLVEVAKEQLEREGDKTMLEWVCEQEKFTKAEFKKAIKASGSTVIKKLEGLKNSGLIAERYNKGTVYYEVKKT